MAKGVGDLKRAELEKGINPEHVLTSKYLEPGLIADFIIEDPDTKEKSKKPVLVIGIEDGQVDFIGIDRQKSDFGHAYKKSFAEIGLGSGEDQEAIQTLDPTTHATSKGLRIPPKYHDKTEAENQLALLKRINQSMGTEEPNTSIEGIANEALAIWTVNQQNAEQANVPDNVHSIAEAQTKPAEKIAA